MFDENSTTVGDNGIGISRDMPLYCAWITETKEIAFQHHKSEGTQLGK